MIAILVFETLATGLAQVFFLDRVYKLSKSAILLGLLSLLSLAGVGTGFAAAVLSNVVVSFEPFEPPWYRYTTDPSPFSPSQSSATNSEGVRSFLLRSALRRVVLIVPPLSQVDFGAFNNVINTAISWKAITFSCDFLITTSSESQFAFDLSLPAVTEPRLPFFDIYRFEVVYLLHRSRNGWRRTDKIVSSLIHFTCEAQILPLMASFFFLVSYTLDTGGKVFFIGSFAEGKLASLSVLHLLNR